MAWSWSGRLVQRVAVVLVVVTAGAVTPGTAAAQAVSPSEREALARLRVSQGGRAEEVDPLVRHADEAAEKGLPVGPLTNKIREGLAKGAALNRIEAVVRQMALDLETADRLLRELQPTTAGDGRETPVLLLAEALGGGVTPEEVGVLHREAQAPDQPPMSADGLGSAAKGLSLIKGAGLPISGGHGRHGRSGAAGIPAARDARSRTGNQASGARLPGRTHKSTRAARGDRARRTSGPIVSRRASRGHRAARHNPPGPCGHPPRADG